MFFTLLVNLLLSFKSTDPKTGDKIQIHTENLSSTRILFLKLLHLYPSQGTLSLDTIYWIENEKLCYEPLQQDIDVSIHYDTEKIISINLDMFRTICWHDTYVRMHIQPQQFIHRDVLVKLTLRALETEKQINQIVLIMLQNAKEEKLKDEDVSVLLCGIIRRKYRGRDEYMKSLLSSPLVTKLEETSTCEALCVAVSSIRNMEHIIDMIVSAAQTSNVTLSDEKFSLILTTLLECKHRRVIQYLRKILRSSISPVISDETFLAAVKTIMHHNISNKEMLQVILSHKQSLSHKC